MLAVGEVYDGGAGFDDAAALEEPVANTILTAFALTGFRGHPPRNQRDRFGRDDGEALAGVEISTS